MVTLTSGQISCTAWAMMWAAEWRITSRASGLFEVTTVIWVPSLSGTLKSRGAKGHHEGVVDRQIRSYYGRREPERGRLSRASCNRVEHAAVTITRQGSDHWMPDPTPVLLVTLIIVEANQNRSVGRISIRRVFPTLAQTPNPRTLKIANNFH